MQIGQDPKPVMRDTYNMFKGGGDPEKFIRLESRKTSHFCASPDIFSCGGVVCGDGGGSGGFGGGGGGGGGGGDGGGGVGVGVGRGGGHGGGGGGGDGGSECGDASGGVGYGSRGGVIF
ncbi:unnamed protein product [Prunus armeniaca]